jgi:hypothetical protein
LYVVSIYIVAQASTWFFSFVARSIASWKQFEIAFLSQFGDDITSGVLLLELSRIRFDKKVKVKYFNQRFINLVNCIPEKRAVSIQVEFYIATLPLATTMFVKEREKRTLAEIFLEAIKVDKDMASISSHQGNEENKPSSSEKKTKKNKGILRMDTEKDNEPMDMARMQRVIKQLTNDIIDLKRNKGEGYKPFNPFMNKRTDFVPQIPPTSSINIEDYAMDNFCHTHHANHSKRTCPEFINYFTTMITPLEPPRRKKRNEKEEEEDDQEKKEEEEGEEPLSHLNLIWDEEEFKDDDDDDIMEEECIGNDYNLQSKGAPKMNDTPSTCKTNNKSSSSKQPSTDKSPEKDKEKKSIKEKETKREVTPSKTPISLDLTQKILGNLKLDYDVVEDLKKMKENIIVFELC